MIEQHELDRVVVGGVQALWPQFSGRMATIDVRSRFRDLLVNHVRNEIDDLFSIDIVDQGTGQWTVVANPVPTAVEIEARERAAAEALEASRMSQIEVDKRRAEAHPNRAAVWQSDDEAFISIDGMMEDLKHWRTPPDLWGEEEAGFCRAIRDVFQYLEVRRKRG